MTGTVPRRPEPPSGFSLVELLVAVGVMLLVWGAVGALVGRAQASFRVQPEMADMQQRLRVGASMLAYDIGMAGAGTTSTAAAGPLLRWVPPLAPYRRGQAGDDARAGVFYRSDAMSILYVPATRAEADVERAIDTGAELVVEPRPNCGVLVHERVCGFTKGMRVVLLDAGGRYDLGTVSAVAGDAVHVVYSGRLASSYRPGRSILAEVAAPTYSLKADPATGAFQLMRYDGYQTDRPVIDNVVGLRFEYFGDPQPPRPLPPPVVEDGPRPSTSYGPAPPPPGSDDPDDAWGAGENCVVAVVAGAPQARLGRLAATPSPVPMDPKSLADGPWCPDEHHPGRFDADLLRVRRVRVRLRVQVAAASMRGPAGVLFSRAGTSSSAEYFAPDQQIVLDITPRNSGVAP